MSEAIFMLINSGDNAFKIEAPKLSDQEKMGSLDSGFRLEGMAFPEVTFKQNGKNGLENVDYGVLPTIILSDRDIAGPNGKKVSDSLNKFMEKPVNIIACVKFYRFTVGEKGARFCSEVYGLANVALSISISNGSYKVRFSVPNQDSSTNSKKAVIMYARHDESGSVKKLCTAALNDYEHLHTDFEGLFKDPAHYGVI